MSNKNKNRDTTDTATTVWYQIRSTVRQCVYELIFAYAVSVGVS